MDEQREFTSDLIQFTALRKPHCIVEYQAQAKPEVVSKARKQALRSLAKQISIPGFRKGKAPDHLLIKHYSHELNEQWKKEIANLSFAFCQKISSYPLLEKETKVSFDIASFSLEEGAKMTFSFESFPLVPEVDPSSLQITAVEPSSIDDKRINEEIEYIREFFAKIEKVENRALDWGDYAIVDVDLLEEDPPTKALKDARFRLKESTTAKWMADILIGMQPGETREGISQPDPDSSDKVKKETPPKQVAVTLHAMEMAHLPSIDDALAQKVGVQTVEEMKSRIRTLLEKQQKEKIHQNYRDQIADQLTEKYPFDLPQSAVDAELRSRIEQMVHHPHFSKKIEAMNEDEKKQLVLDLKNQGKKSLLLFYLAQKIVEDQKIRISLEEEKESNTLLDNLFLPKQPTYHPKQNSREEKFLVFSRLVLEKAEDYLIEKAHKVDPPKEQNGSAIKE